MTDDATPDVGSDANAGQAERMPRRTKRAVAERQNADVVVTLVHGTWARHSAWAKPGSAFREQVEASLPGLRGIETFEWSGRNSADARQMAAWRLRHHAENIRRNHIGAGHYVVAHSHGGTVALNAFATTSRKPDEDIDGMACLATPFISFREVQWGDIDEEDRGPLVTWATMGGVILILIALGQFVTALIWSLNMPTWTALFLNALLFLLTMLVLPISAEFWRDSKGFDYDANALEGLNLLIIRSPGDEASSALAASHFVSWIAGRLHRLSSWLILRPVYVANLILASIQAGLGKRLGSVFWFGILGVGLLLWQFGAARVYLALLEWLGLSPPRYLYPIGFWSWMGGIDPRHPALLRAEEWLEPLNTAGVFVFGYLMLSGFVLELFTVSLWLCGLPFGFWRPDLFPTYYVTVEATPPGSWEVHELRAQSDLFGSAGSGSGAFAHSEPYSNPEAITLLVKWILKSEKRRRSPVSI
jgi:hypothetical protein